MNLAVLFSGGKDSTFAIYAAQKMGHKVSCLVTILTNSEESHLLHHPNVSQTTLQAKAMKIPQILIQSKSDDITQELQSLREGLVQAKQIHHIEGVVHGGILSEFQKTRFEGVAKELDLQMVTPIWKKDQKQYMNELLDHNFEFIIIAVSTDGLDESWLGKKITKQDLNVLIEKSEKHKFNLSFEGGEAETFVINCPLFSGMIEVIDSKKSWDGYRGRFEILAAKMKNNAG